MSRFALILIAISLSGCAVTLTEEGRMIREINRDWANECEYMGIHEVKIPLHENGSYIPRNEILNQVAAVGGNAYIKQGNAGRRFQFEVFRCAS